MSNKEEDYFSEVVKNATLMEMKNNIKANENLGITQEYKRQYYDNDSAKKAYKKELFNGKKTIKDPVTGKTLHIEHVKAKSMYKAQSGSKAWAQHAAETDHVISLKQGHEVLKGNPFLSDEDVKEILNDKRYNYIVKSKSLNASKQAKSDIGMALTAKDMPMESRANLIAGQGKAVAGVAAHATVLTTKNISNEFSNGAANALQASAVPVLVEGVHNLYLVANGEKEFSEAAKDMGRLTSGVAISGGATQILTTGANNMLRNSSKEALQKLADSNQITQIITVALILKDSVVKYVNGEIDGEEFFNEVGEKGVGLLSGAIGSIIGQALIPIPIVGAFIGSVVISTACTAIYREYSSLNEHKEKLKKVDIITSQALSEMERQRNVLKSMVGEKYEQWDKQFNLGFEQINKAMLNNDVSSISDGLNNILAVFNKSINFKTYEEFDEFFMDDNSVLKL